MKNNEYDENNIMENTFIYIKFNNSMHLNINMYIVITSVHALIQIYL